MPPAITKHDIIKTIVVAIDGPSGSGKTTTAREVARRMSLRHLDTGAMYRAVTFKALRAELDLGDADAMGVTAERSDIGFVEREGGAQRVFLDEEDVSTAIRSGEVTANVSLVSSHASVRRAMVRRQRMLADSGGVVLEGRDIGSVVLPSADVKIYLDASIDVRASRRHKELVERGVETNIDEVRQTIERRDAFDRTRDVSPLMVPVGARILDTSELTIEAQVNEVIRIAEETAAAIFEAVAQPGTRNPMNRKRWDWGLARLLIRAVCRVLFGLRILDRNRADYAEPFLYACNHRSNIDPPLIGASMKREIHFVAKQALFANALFGRVIRRYNAIPLRRGVFDRDAMDRALELLAGGESLLIFPEGGRVSGDDLGESRAGVGFLALKSGKPVVPIYIHGNGSLRNALRRDPAVAVIIGRPIRLTDPSNYGTTDDIREFGRMVMAAIGALKDEYEWRLGRRRSAG